MTGESIMPYGKHKGKRLDEIPDGYWLYMYDRKQLKGKLLKYVEETVPLIRFLKEKKESGTNQ
jgi:uncharacterized protein (DUF3820 family)